MSLRVGIDVGGTFTKAVAVAPRTLELRAQASLPTTHTAPSGVGEGVARALRDLVHDPGVTEDEIELVAFSTTQAMNALLEGDVARVGVVGVGRQPDLRPARKRTSIGDVPLAPGRRLHTEHAFLNATSGLAETAIDAALDGLAAAGCDAIAASGAFAVDAPEAERLIAERARARGLPTCAGHELSGAYGLELRTLSAAINASILPLMERTAGVVEDVLRSEGLDVPLLVLRGDGGAMSVDAFRRTPSFSIGAGPAAGVAAALHQLQLSDAIVLECGGTSSNVSVVKHGRTVLRSLKVMGQPTAIRSVDSWVVGAAGGSMGRLRRRRLAEGGPRSAHVAGLPYACFAEPAELEDAALTLVAPRPGDPDSYLAVRNTAGRTFALTATCAANALGLVRADSHAAGSRPAALAAFAPLAARLRTTPEQAARRLLDAVVDKIAGAAQEAARTHGFGADVPVVALGGSGPALAGEVARRLGRALLEPEHPEVLSSIGAALSLIRAEVVRTATGEPGAGARVARDAQRACVEAGAAPDTVRVESSYEAAAGELRAVATGAVALERGAANREPLDDDGRHAAAVRALRTDAAELRLVAGNDFYRVYSRNGGGPVAVVDAHGSVPLAADARRTLVAPARALLDQLSGAVEQASVQLGIGAMLPRVAIVTGPRIIDASDARRPHEILATARAALEEHDEHDGDAVAILWH